MPALVGTSAWEREDWLVARLKQVVVDCAAPAALARFWAAALDGFAVRPYDDAEVARLAELGLHAGDGSECHRRWPSP